MNQQIKEQVDLILDEEIACTYRDLSLAERESLLDAIERDGNVERSVMRWISGR